MPRTTWNNGSSIPISGLKESELKEAMKAWSEGNPHLENLLWTCYQNGVYTRACDSGDHGHVAYVDLDIENSGENIKKVLDVLWSLENVELFLELIGNPYSGPQWFKPTLGIFLGKNDDTNDFFDTVSKRLNEPYFSSHENPFGNILSLYEALKGKDRDFDVIMKKNSAGEFRLVFSCNGNKFEWDYLTRLMKDAGLTSFMKVNEEKEYMSWGYTCSCPECFSAVVKKLQDVLNTKMSLEVLDKETKGMTFRTVALIMRRKFGTDERGIKLMNDWLNQHKCFNGPDVNY